MLIEPHTYGDIAREHQAHRLAAAFISQRAPVKEEPPCREFSECYTLNRNSNEFRIKTISMKPRHNFRLTWNGILTIAILLKIRLYVGFLNTLRVLSKAIEVA